MPKHLFQRALHVSSRIGKMAANVPIKKVCAELKEESHRLGYQSISMRLLEERKILKLLEKEQERAKQKMLEDFVAPLVLRAADGYSTQGFAWNKSQENSKALRDSVMENQQRIDWLKTRQLCWDKEHSFFQSESQSSDPVKLDEKEKPFNPGNK